ncbi:uncharacterized protein LOC120004839 [Tripterygium wilfordii]|uniref:uncharacterized protein LOC120004839 n=1 Tax=Tripterygium wilfordii TaxID=458696 RepID=UPI0018F80735|nr:uncharacterized protein LOC120004839 [Tripterygium wilfordii]
MILFCHISCEQQKYSCCLARIEFIFRADGSETILTIRICSMRILRMRISSCEFRCKMENLMMLFENEKGRIEIYNPQPNFQVSTTKGIPSFLNYVIPPDDPLGN